MSSALLDRFIEDAQACASRCANPANCVDVVAPIMQRLLGHADSFLTEAHLRSDPAHYTRNAILMSSDGALSLYALVWLPGQWTPIHDHGSWGVVGVVQGMLEERSYIRIDPNRATDDNQIDKSDATNNGDSNIDLVRGGVFLLAPGTVSTFVPNPDHIHVTGVPANGQRTVSLHLYGRNMNHFCVYDLEKRARTRVALAHNES